MAKSLTRFIGGLFLVASTIGTGAGVGLALATAGPAGATVVTPLVVDDAVDHAATPANCTTPVANQCTLRDAVVAASSAGVDVTITLPSDTLNVDSAFGQIDISGGHTVTVTGNGASNTILEATSATTINNRVLKVEQGTIATVSGVTVEDGNPNGGIGGGILDCGTLLLSNSTVTQNVASETGGGIELSAHGSATLTNDTISGNTATNGLDITSDFVAGGGIAVDNSSATATENLTLEDTTVTGNMGLGDGGGIVTFNTSGGFPPTLDPNLAVNISDSTISDNQINHGESSLPVFGAGLSPEDGVWNVSGSTITGNAALGGPGPEVIGAGVNVFTPGLSQTQTFSDDTITGNTAYDGGGVALDGGATNISTSTIDGNSGTEAFGGVLDETGAISDGGAVNIASSTISNNTSILLLGESPFLGDGGGVSSIGCNPLNLTNDTVTGNRVSNEGGGYFGAGCGNTAGPQASARTAHQKQPHITTTGSTHLLFDTIDANTTGDSTGGGNIQLGSTTIADHSTVTLQNTIVSNGIVGTSPTTNCSAATGATIASAGYNLIDDSTCGTPAGTDIIGQSPQLGALANNGGPTQTEKPADKSPAVAAIPDAVWVATGVAADQRGIARGAGPASSATIGAVEVGVNFNGYRLVANEGGIFDFGLDFNGSLANNHLNAPIVGIANSPGPNGYLMAGGDGGVFALGGANFFGSLGGQAIPSPIAAIAATPSEDGYWLASQSGTIYHFGNTPALPAVQLPPGAHIVGMASTNTGKGLWLVDNFGDVYTTGDAPYQGGLGGVTINAPIVGIAAAANGQGYVLVASDGGVFCFGVPFHGSVPGSLMPGQHLVAPIVGIAVTHSGNGYWEVGADGGVFTYGDAPFLGSIYTAIGNTPLNGPIVGIQHLGSASG